MSKMLAVSDQCKSASKLLSQITVLDAIRWVSQSWKLLQSDTISACFIKAGFGAAPIIKSEPVVNSVNLDFTFETNNEFVESFR